MFPHHETEIKLLFSEASSLIIIHQGVYTIWKTWQTLGLLSLYSTTYGGYLQASPLLSLKYCSSSVYVVKAVITLNIIYLFPHTAFAGRQGSSATSSQEPGQGIVCRQVAAVILLSTHQLTITITHSTYSARRHSKPVASGPCRGQN